MNDELLASIEREMLGWTRAGKETPRGGRGQGRFWFHWRPSTSLATGRSDTPTTPAWRTSCSRGRSTTSFLRRTGEATRGSIRGCRELPCSGAGRRARGHGTLPPELRAITSAKAATGGPNLVGPRMTMWGNGSSCPTLRRRESVEEKALSRGDPQAKGGATEGDGEVSVPRTADRDDHRMDNRQTGHPTLQPMISVSNLSKTYASGFQALKKINLDIRRGEIFALLGPNGAGKTTLISIICGIVNPSQGVVLADGHDIVTEYRAARSMIGLVPQELTTDAFETVWATVTYSRGLFGKPANPDYIEKVLRDLSLWDKKDAKIMALSGGMKRRVMIAKALSHEPRILFLDEPTAGVDVELRRDMWAMVRALRASGVTIILTTHYIEEAEEMADRIGVISKGEIILVEDKALLMRKLGKKQLTLHLQNPLAAVPPQLAPYRLELSDGGTQLVYTFDDQAEHTGIADLLRDLGGQGIDFKDLHTTQSSLEDIFVNLVSGRP